MRNAKTDENNTAFCNLKSVGGLETTEYAAGYKGRKWSIDPPAEVSKHLFDFEAPNSRTTLIAMVDPDAELLTGAPVIVRFGSQQVAFGRLDTKHPGKAKRMSVSLVVDDGVRLFKNYFERVTVEPVIGLCQCERYR
jgi:hypothetical protein